MSRRENRRRRRKATRRKPARANATYDEAVTRFRSRLHDDWPRLREAFAGCPAQPSQMQIWRAGDRHHGESVIIVQFPCGWRVAYKPRSAAVDLKFADLLRWLRQAGLRHHLYIPRVIDSGDYFWMEFVRHRTCKSEEEIRRSYAHAGILAAVLQVLRATDFHRFNLVAHADSPVLLDLETLLQATIGNSNGDKLGADRWRDSVARLGLFRRKQSYRDATGCDLSGLGAPYQPRDRSPVARPYTGHAPTLRGHPVRAAAYCEEIVSSFSATYGFLMEHQSELLAADGPLNAFAGTPVRLVLRSTRDYCDFLRASPAERLSNLQATLTDRPELEPVIPLELAALRAANIPRFEVLADGRDLLDGAGGRVRGFLRESGLSQARQRLQAMNEVDLQHQIDFIRYSFRRPIVAS